MSFYGEVIYYDDLQPEVQLPNNTPGMAHTCNQHSGRQRQVDLRVQGQSGLQNEFQNSQGYTETLSRKNQKQNKTKTKKPNQLNDIRLKSSNTLRLLKQIHL